MITLPHRRSTLPSLVATLVLTALVLAGCQGQPDHVEYTAHSDPILAIDISPDGALIATSSVDGSIAVWQRNPLTQVATLPAHSAWATDVAFHPLLPTLASSGEDGTVVFFSTQTWHPSPTLATESQRIRALAYSPDGAYLALALDDGSVSVRDATTLKRLMLLVPSASRTNSVVFSPDAAYVLLAHAGDSPEEILATLWDPSKGAQVAALTGHISAAQALASSQPDVGNQLLQANVTWGSVNDAAYSQDARFIATVGADGSLRLWDGDTLAYVGSISIPDTVLYAVSFTHSGDRVFAGGSLGRGFIWETPRLRQVLALPEEGVVLNDALFSPDGSFIAAGYYDGIVRIWSIP